MNLPSHFERLLVEGDEQQRAVAHEALTLLRELATDDTPPDHVVTNPRVLELLTRLEVLDRRSMPVFRVVEHVLDALPDLETESGVERLFRVLQAALDSRPPTLWHSLVARLRNNDFARDVLTAVQGVFLLLAYARMEASADARELVPDTEITRGPQRGDA